jgi:hypothetical protein
MQPAAAYTQGPSTPSLACGAPLGEEERAVELGAFSISLAVKDLRASGEFCTKLGFQEFGGDAEHNRLILKNGQTVIGLFQGMFEKNILTFNPGWDSSAQELKNFTDVREIQRRLKAQGVALVTSTPGARPAC